MVEPLERRLAADAERALAHRVVGVALELHDPTLAVPREHAAAGGALAAYRREPRRDAGDELLVRHDERQDVLGRGLAAGGRGGGAGRPDELEEVAPLHLAGAPVRSRARVASDRHVVAP